MELCLECAIRLNMIYEADEYHHTTNCNQQICHIRLLIADNKDVTSNCSI